MNLPTLTRVVARCPSCNLPVHLRVPTEHRDEGDTLVVSYDFTGLGLHVRRCSPTVVRCRHCTFTIRDGRCAPYCGKAEPKEAP